MQPGEPSATAQGVAAHRVAVDRLAVDYGDADADDRLQRAVAGDQPQVGHMERYLTLRTRHFDAVVVDAVAAGIGQLVAVGAGYDGRCLRYARPDLRWFELDHPATQADKRARLDVLGLDASAVTFVPADFVTDDVGAALTGADLDPSAPSLFTCEGVAGYLPVDALAGLLAALAGVAGPGSRLAVEIPVAPDTPKERERRRALRAMVGDLGEPLVTDVPRAEVRSFLADAGWEPVAVDDPLGVPIEASTRTTTFASARRAG